MKKIAIFNQYIAISRKRYNVWPQLGTRMWSIE